jgi:hypothetical protein
VAIPAEHLDRIDIYHLGENGRVVGCGSASRFPGSRVEGLLETWLDSQVMASVKLYRPPQAVDFEIPRILEGGVEFERISLTPEPYGMMPIARFDESTRTVRTRWPPEGKNFQTVSPDAESEEAYGPIRRAEFAGIPDWVSANGEYRTLFTFASWPEPLGQLVPDADGVDLFLGQQQMRTIAEAYDEDPQRARSEAIRLARSYVLEGHSSRLWAWLWPICLGDGDEAMCFAAEDLGFAAPSPSELFGTAEFRKAMNESIPIRRVWGPLGLFWALLLEILEGHEAFRACGRCGRFIRGKRGKMYCGRHDNPVCYAQRRSLDQRRSRRRRPKN